VLREKGATIDRGGLSHATPIHRNDGNARSRREPAGSAIPGTTGAETTGGANRRAGASQGAIDRNLSIDLQPTGTTLTLSKPKLEGDFYTFISLPEKVTTRIRKSAVKKITPLTSDLNKETAYQIELLPSGRVLARERPQLKTGAYVFHTYKTGTLMSVKKADVKQVTLLQGLPAFKAKQEEMGAKLLVGNLSMEGGSIRVIPDPGAHTAPPASDASAPSNWNYDGVPGATDAYAPSNAVVAHPGDVPKAPEPPPPPPPR
jgi:hypothetical protein